MPRKPVDLSAEPETPDGANGAIAVSPAVRAANTLTERWCAGQGGGDFVLSGAGLWPLLALLASAADEAARADLAAALGRPAESAREDSRLPEGVVGTLTDQAALDSWAAEGTRGLIDTFPAPITPDTLLLLATPLAARVKWRTARPPETHSVTVADVSADRPFGFLAVHRPSRLAVAAGWVDSPFGDSNSGGGRR